MKITNIYLEISKNEQLEGEDLKTKIFTLIEVLDRIPGIDAVEATSVQIVPDYTFGITADETTKIRLTFRSKEELIGQQESIEQEEPRSPLNRSIWEWTNPNLTKEIT